MKSFFKGLRSITILGALVIGLMYAIMQTGQFDYAGPRSTVHAIYGEAEAKSSQGSGVMIAPRLMLTVAHGMTNGPVFVGALRAPAKVLRVDKEKDLALLLVAMDCPCARVAAVEPEIDERLLAIGYPMNTVLGVQVLTEGRYQGVKAESPSAAITTPLAPGNSGGGVFAWDGMRWSLVGIAEGVTVTLLRSRFLPYEQSMLSHLGSAVSFDAMKAFLNGRSSLELWSLKPENIENIPPFTKPGDDEAETWNQLAKDLAELQRLIKEWVREIEALR
jgi:S1-C subfamily serine protease